MKEKKSSSKPKVHHQFIKFGYIGIVTAILNVFILYFLTEVFKWYYIYSALASFFIATFVCFILNKKYTFKETISLNFMDRLNSFFMINLGTLIINLLVLRYLTENFKIYYLFSQLISLAVVAVINFWGHKTWTFKK
jgi:putative flippase GtrA